MEAKRSIAEEIEGVEDATAMMNLAATAHPAGSPNNEGSSDMDNRESQSNSVDKETALSTAVQKSDPSETLTEDPWNSSVSGATDNDEHQARTIAGNTGQGIAVAGPSSGILLHGEASTLINQYLNTTVDNGESKALSLTKPNLNHETDKVERAAVEDASMTRPNPNDKTEAAESVENEALSLQDLAVIKAFEDLINGAMNPTRSERNKDTDIQEPHAECVVCTVTNARRTLCSMPCGHHCCQRCMYDLFRFAIVNEAHFPPQCCKMAIPWDAEYYMTSAMVKTLEEKPIEFNTSDRTYCSRRECSSFIPPAAIFHDLATCAACQTRTCSKCKNSAHDGACPEDTGTQQVLDLGKEQRWQRCYKCRRLVGLEDGCYHISLVLSFCTLEPRHLLTSSIAVHVVPNFGERPCSSIPSRFSLTLLATSAVCLGRNAHVSQVQVTTKITPEQYAGTNGAIFVGHADAIYAMIAFASSSTSARAARLGSVTDAGAH